MHKLLPYTPLKAKEWVHIVFRFPQSGLCQIHSVCQFTLFPTLILPHASPWDLVSDSVRSLSSKLSSSAGTTVRVFIPLVFFLQTCFLGQSHMSSGWSCLYRAFSIADIAPSAHVNNPCCCRGWWIVLSLVLPWDLVHLFINSSSTKPLNFLIGMFHLFSPGILTNTPKYCHSEKSVTFPFNLFDDLFVSPYEFTLLNLDKLWHSSFSLNHHLPLRACFFA